MERMIETACSFSGVRFVFALKSVERSFFAMERNEKDTFDPMAILNKHIIHYECRRIWTYMAARVVSSFFIVAIFKFPSVEA